MGPSALPEGDPAPADGRLPDGIRVRGGRGAAATFSAYVHVPFCRTRCGYCDFNTYAPGELSGPGSTATAYVGAFVREVALARDVLGAQSPPLDTVFFGGGTPTLLGATALVDMARTLRATWGFAEDAEVTTEANPDSVTPEGLAELREGGFTRVSFGMQSAVPHVLATLERTHDPDNVARAVGGARAAGLQVSLDLIYATPGESPGDWDASLVAAIALEPDHISAYALVVEEGTRLAAQVRRGDLALPDDDDAADKYERADTLLGAAGYQWYEVSNWSRPGAACRHNLAYWRGGDWWGFGPGAHSHVGGVRWWNVKHPSAYAARLAAGRSPAAAREILSEEDRLTEAVLLGIRLAEGLDEGALTGSGSALLPLLRAEGLIAGPDASPRRVVLTRRGRLLADGVVHRLLAGGIS